MLGALRAGLLDARDYTHRDLPMFLLPRIGRLANDASIPFQGRL
jgi:hypothetical protein